MSTRKKTARKPVKKPARKSVAKPKAKTISPLDLMLDMARIDSRLDVLSASFNQWCITMGNKHTALEKRCDEIAANLIKSKDLLDNDLAKANENLRALAVSVHDKLEALRDDGK